MPAFSWPKRLLEEDRKIKAYKKKLLKQQTKDSGRNQNPTRQWVIW